MKTKVLVGSIVALWVVGLTIAACLWLSRPQTIVLSDGTRLTLLSVTYGKHHVFSKSSSARWTDEVSGWLQALHVLPKSKSANRRMQNMPVNTTNDSICVWIEQKHSQNNWPNFQILACDPANTGCAGECVRTYASFNGNQQGDEIMGYAFDAFPRRGGKILFRIQAWNNRNGRQDAVKDYFVVSNPAKRGGFASWTPDKLPVTQQDGDLEVTLTRLTTEANTFNRFGGTGETNDPSSRGMLAAFRVEQAGVLVTNWQPVQVETTDGTGNHTKARRPLNRQENEEQIVIYQWGLWPNEPAWKMRVEMSRTAGFTADEMWTATNIPINLGSMNDMFGGSGRTSKPAAETKLGETSLQIFPAIKMPADQVRNFGGNMEGVIRVVTQPPPEGMRLTVVSITDDQDRPIALNSNMFGSGSASPEHRYSLKKLGDAKSLNITLAVHRSRYVEYTVKPAQ